MVLGVGAEVIIADYDPEWPRLFEEERALIAGALGDAAVGIEHVGSTSVPGLAAKPIIDIMVVARPFPLPLELVDAVCGLGYYYKGPFGIPGRQYFTKGRLNSTHHIHAYSEGHAEVDRHLLFRDYLRAIPEEARRYETLKRDLAARYRDRRDDYTDLKTPFIREIEALARERKARGGTSGGSGKSPSGSARDEGFPGTE